MEERAASAAKEESPWCHVVVPTVVALVLATLGQFVATAAVNLKPRVAAEHISAQVSYGTSRVGVRSLARADSVSSPEVASEHSRASYSYCSASCSKVMSIENADGHRWTYADALGSIRTLGDDAGNATDAKTYNAYGTDGPFATGTNAQPYGFAGERTDGSGNQWLRARWYAPDQGRFLSRDKAGDHPYAYAGGNPVRFTDPSGNDYAGTLGPATTVAVLGALLLIGTVTFLVATKAPPISITLPRPGPRAPPTPSPSAPPSPAPTPVPTSIYPEPSPTEIGVYYRHYTTGERAERIMASGVILTGNENKVWVTPDLYSKKFEAKARLALPTVPDGYFVIPEDRLWGLSPVATVQPRYDDPGGGSEAFVTHDVNAVGLIFVWLPS